MKSVIVAKLQEKSQEMDAESETKLKQQITELSKKESPVRTLMWKRLLTYVRLVKTSKMCPPPPPGYTDLSDELEKFATAFKRITIYNYSVFGEHFENLLDEIRSGKSVSAETSTSPSKKQSSSTETLKTDAAASSSST